MTRRYVTRVNEAILTNFFKGGTQSDFIMPCSCTLRAVPKQGITFPKTLVTLLKSDIISNGDMCEFYCEKDDNVQLSDCTLYAYIGLGNWMLIGEV